MVDKVRSTLRNKWRERSDYLSCYKNSILCGGRYSTKTGLCWNHKYAGKNSIFWYSVKPDRPGKKRRPVMVIGGGMFQSRKKVYIYYDRYLYEKCAGVELPNNVVVRNLSSKFWPNFEDLILEGRGNTSEHTVAGLIEKDLMGMS